MAGRRGGEGSTPPSFDARGPREGRSETNARPSPPRGSFGNSRHAWSMTGPTMRSLHRCCFGFILLLRARFALRPSCNSRATSGALLSEEGYAAAGDLKIVMFSHLLPARRYPLWPSLFASPFLAPPPPPPYVCGSFSIKTRWIHGYVTVPTPHLWDIVELAGVPLNIGACVVHSVSPFARRR